MAYNNPRSVFVSHSGPGSNYPSPDLSSGGSPSPSRSSPSQSLPSHSQDNLLYEHEQIANPDQLGSRVPETYPVFRQSVLADNPSHAVDSAVVRFVPKRVSGVNDDLTFRPTILMPISTLLLVLLYIGVALGIGALWWTSGRDRQFQISSENVHVVARYFPSIIGTINVLLFRHTIREFLRMTPFINMADQQFPRPGAVPWKSVSGAFFPWQDISITPGFISGLSLLCHIVASLIVSLKVVLLATVHREKAWTLTIRTYPAFALVGGHLLMAAYTAFVGILLRGKSCGLKWDPVSIADYVSLFAHCNALDYFEPLELRHETAARNAMSTSQVFRLGYWEKYTEHSDVPETVYGVGVGWDADQGAPLAGTRRADPAKSSWFTGCFQKANQPDPIPLNPDRENGCACKARPNCEHYPFRQSPGCARWLLVCSTLVIWASFAASIYALVRGWPMNGFALNNEWSLPANLSVSMDDRTFFLPSVDPTDPKSTLLAYALLFRSLPTYIAGLFTSIVLPAVDLNMRFMQPFVNMFEEPGEASNTVLLAYITLSPLRVPLTALHKGHYRVSWYSTLNLVSPLFPIFVGGLLTVAGDEDQVKFSFSLSAYIGVMASLLLCSLSLPCAFPLSKRLLPRQFHSMADLMAMCYQARFLSSPHLNIADPRRTPTKEHMEARILLNGDKFLFGVYTGRDNRPHLGFDIAVTRGEDYGPEKPTGFVQWIRPEGLRWRIRERLRETTKRVTTLRLESGREDYMEASMGHFPERENRILCDRYEMTGAINAGQTAASSTGLDVQDVRPSGRTRTNLGPDDFGRPP